jgi:hypothetical protein
MPKGDGGDCKILVIQHLDREKFKVRQLSVDEKSLSDWNLAIFRGPARPDYKTLKVVTSMQCKHLFLEFQSAAERKRFSDDFEVVMGHYEEAISEYSKNRAKFTHEADRPVGPSNSVYNPRSPRSSIISTPSTIQ